MRRHLPIITILVLAACLRLLALGQIPGGISPDEVSQGYSAYSLLKTGKDEWGISFPVTSFKSFLDYKAVLQTYLMIPTVAIFGLSEFSVRLPSAIFGTLAVIAIFLLTNELFDSKKIKLGKIELTIGHLAAFLLAISPWHFQFSRTALEVNLSSFLFPLGLYLFLKGLKNPALLMWSGIIISLNLYSYHAAKYFEPLFFISLLFIYRKSLKKISKRSFLPVLIISVIIATPILFATVFGQAGNRAKDLLITQLNPREIDSIAKIQYLSPLNQISLIIPRIFSNKATFIINQFVNNYVSYLSPTFWFTEGGREVTYSILPGTGLLYLWLFPLVVCGIYCLIIEKHHSLSLLSFWFFLAIIPAALTKEGYRPNRVGALLDFWEIIAAFGFIEFYIRFNIEKKKTLAAFLGLGAIILTAFYFNTYFFEYPYKFPDALSYGYRDLVKIVQSYPKTANIIIDKGTNSQSFFAFYEKMDPLTFQRNSKVWLTLVQQSNPRYLDQLEGYQLENLTFKTFNPSSDLVKGKIVIISSNKMNDSLMPYIKDKVEYPDRSIAFYLLEKK